MLTLATNYGARKQRFPSFLKSIDLPANMPPRPNATRWTSLCRAIEYHGKFLEAEKSYIQYELFGSDADVLKQSKLLATLVLFEADSCLSFFTYSYVEFLMVTSWKHCNFPYDSVSEICIQLRESFTSAEKSDLCILV